MPPRIRCGRLNDYGQPCGRILSKPSAAARPHLPRERDWSAAVSAAGQDPQELLRLSEAMIADGQSIRWLCPGNRRDRAAGRRHEHLVSRAVWTSFTEERAQRAWAAFIESARAAGEPASVEAFAALPVPDVWLGIDLPT